MPLTSTIALSGTITAGNIVTVAIQHASLAHGIRSVTYTVASTDTLATIATLWPARSLAIPYLAIEQLPLPPLEVSSQ